MTDQELIEQFGRRDVLSGSTATLQQGEQVITGRILRVDPMAGLLVEADGREVWLPAATTTVQSVAEPSR